jgi:hypothetical protein
LPAAVENILDMRRRREDEAFCTSGAKLQALSIETGGFGRTPSVSVIPDV